MMMNELLQHIRHLVFTSGSVAVEGVGVFMLSHQSASFTEDSILGGPCHTVSFSAEGYPQGTEELERSYMRRNGYDAEAAHAAVSRDLEILTGALEAGETVEISGVGSLRLDRASGQIMFEACPDQWLLPLQVSRIEEPAATEADSTETDYEEMWITERRRNMFRAVRRPASGAAAIVIFAVLAFVVSHLPDRTSVIPQVAGFGIGQNASVAEEEQISSPEASEPTLVLVLNTPSDGIDTAKVRYRDIKKAEAPAGRYCLVVASLASKSEAEKFITGHSTTDMPLRVLDNDGRWRVYAHSAPSIEELTVAGRNLGVYDAYPSAWICRR